MILLQFVGDFFGQFYHLIDKCPLDKFPTTAAKWIAIVGRKKSKIYILKKGSIKGIKAMIFGQKDYWLQKKVVCVPFFINFVTVIYNQFGIPGAMCIEK